MGLRVANISSCTEICGAHIQQRGHSIGVTITTKAWLGAPSSGEVGKLNIHYQQHCRILRYRSSTTTVLPPCSTQAYEALEQQRRCWAGGACERASRRKKETSAKNHKDKQKTQKTMKGDKNNVPEHANKAQGRRYSQQADAQAQPQPQQR